MNIHLNRLSRLLVGTAVAAVVVAGCGSGPGTSSGSSSSAPSSATAAQGEHNDADVTFVQGMIPHHRQAVEMAGLAAGRSQRPQVLDLASRIGAGQGPEIATMIGWLQEWGAEVPAEDSMGGMGGMDQGGGPMMTPEQMGRLGQASGAMFDRMFLEMMTEHHGGAIEMARTELDQGADPRATQLAQTIIDTQRAEITEMEALLAQV
jgi:uncharacterized protein (DUF305 family)